MTSRSRRLASLGVVGTALSIAVPAAVSVSPAYAASPTVGYVELHGGYVASAGSWGPPTALVGANFVAPTVACTRAKAEVVLGVDVFADLAPGPSQSFVRADCLKGKLTFGAGIAIGGVESTLATTVHPADQITVSVSQTAAMSSATFTDNTSGFTQTITGPGAVAEDGYIGSIPSSAQRAGSIWRIPAFSTVSFSNTDVNGAGIGSYSAGGFGPVELIQTHGQKPPPKGKIEVQPGSLVGTSSFQLTWMS